MLHSVYLSPSVSYAESFDYIGHKRSTSGSCVLYV